MAQTNFYLGKTTNHAGDSEISMRLYVSRDVHKKTSELVL